MVVRLFFIDMREIDNSLRVLQDTISYGHKGVTIVSR